MNQCRNLRRENKLRRLRKKTSICIKCSELARSRSQVVMGYGDCNARVLIIGEAPGRYGADLTGVPFTKDKSGILLQKMLVKIGMNKDDESFERPTLEDVYLTNIVRCNPKDKLGKNRSPKYEEVVNCKEYIEKEIDIINPQILIPLGINASKCILGSEFQGNKFGRIIKNKNRFVYPLWHPGFVVRGGGKLGITPEKYYSYFVYIQRFIEKLSIEHG